MANIGCPECGQELDGLGAEQILAHARDHWPDDIDDKTQYAEARRRQGMVLELHAEVSHRERREQVEQRAEKAAHPEPSGPRWYEHGRRRGGQQPAEEPKDEGK